MNREVNNLRVRYIQANVIASEISNHTVKEWVNSTLRKIANDLNRRDEITVERLKEINEDLKKIEELDK